MQNFVLRDLDTGETRLITDETVVEQAAHPGAIIRKQSKERMTARASGRAAANALTAAGANAGMEIGATTTATSANANASSTPSTSADAAENEVVVEEMNPNGYERHTPRRTSDAKGIRRRISSSQKRTQSDELLHACSDAGRSADIVRVTAHKKRERDFAYMYRWQEVKHAHHGPIRVLAFNPNGKLLATAGSDRTIKIWDVDAKVEDKIGGTGASAGASKPFRTAGSGVSSGGEEAQTLFVQYQYQRQYLRKGEPKIQLHGHTAEIVDMSWSKNDFLASGGMDKTVRLWHASKRTCLRVFWHNDFVTTVRFHTTDEQVCISGTSDGTLSLWHMKEEKLLSQAQLDDFITTSTITPDGSTVLVGTRHGRVKFYSLFDEIQGEWQFVHTTQLDVRSRRERKGCGKKVAGIVFRPGDEELCVSSSDSRMRLYRYDDKALLSKFMGHVNEESQLCASFSPCGTFVLTASENRSVCMWEVNNQGLMMKRRETSAAAGSSRRKENTQPNDKGKNISCETFDPHDNAFLSAAVFAPRKAKVPPSYKKQGAQVINSRRAFGLVLVTASEEGDIRVFGCI